MPARLEASDLSDVKTLRATYLNIRDLLGFNKIVISLAALEVVQGYLGNGDNALVSAEITGAQSVMDEEE